MPKTKRLKIYRAGNLEKAVLWTPPLPNDNARDRQSKIKATRQAREFINTENRELNDKASLNKLELKLAGNFSPNDLFITLTYSNEYLPNDKKESVVYAKLKENMRSFIKNMRNIRKKRGKTFKYIYSIGGNGSNSVDDAESIRFHYHMVMNSTGKIDIDDIKSFWKYGEITYISKISESETKGRTYGEVAGYFGKQNPFRPNGKQLYTCSKNLLNIEDFVVFNDFVEDNTTIIMPENVEPLGDQAGHPDYGKGFLAYYKCLYLPESTGYEPYPKCLRSHRNDRK